MIIEIINVESCKSIQYQLDALEQEKETITVKKAFDFQEDKPVVQWHTNIESEHAESNKESRGQLVHASNGNESIAGITPMTLL